MAPRRSSRLRIDSEGYSTTDLEEALARSLKDFRHSPENQHQEQQQREEKQAEKAEVQKEELPPKKKRGRRKRGQSLQEENKSSAGEPEAQQTERKDEDTQGKPADQKEHISRQDTEAGRNRISRGRSPTPVSTNKRKRRRKDVVRKHFGYEEREEKDPSSEVCVLDSGDEKSPVEDRVMRDDRIFAYPSRSHCDPVMFGREDVNCLEETNYINDVVVALYIKHVLPNPRHRIHVFDSFFYPVLSVAVCKDPPDLERLKNWLKGVDIFEKTYVLIPVHHRSHWSLAMMCFAKPGCHLLHFDSMRTGHTSRIVYEVLRRYLMAEWAARGRAKADIKYRVRKVKVPHQKNDYDCGIFMLHFIQKVLSNAPPEFSEDLPNKMGDWFSWIEASELRANFRNVLQGVSRDQSTPVEGAGQTRESEEKAGEAGENPQQQSTTDDQKQAGAGAESQQITGQVQGDPQVLTS